MREGGDSTTLWRPEIRPLPFNTIDNVDSVEGSDSVNNVNGRQLLTMLAMVGNQCYQ